MCMCRYTDVAVQTNYVICIPLALCMCSMLLVGSVACVPAIKMDQKNEGQVDWLGLRIWLNLSVMLQCI